MDEAADQGHTASERRAGLVSAGSLIITVQKAAAVYKSPGTLVPLLKQFQKQGRLGQRACQISASCFRPDSCAGHGAQRQQHPPAWAMTSPRTAASTRWVRVGFDQFGCKPDTWQGGLLDSDGVKGHAW